MLSSYLSCLREPWEQILTFTCKYTEKHASLFAVWINWMLVPSLAFPLSLSMQLSSFLSEGAVSFKDETISTGLSEPQILRPLLDAAKGWADKRKWKTIPIAFWLFEWKNNNECSKGNVELRDFANDEENHNDVYWQTVRQPAVGQLLEIDYKGFLAYEVSISTAIINISTAAKSNITSQLNTVFN